MFPFDAMFDDRLLVNTKTSRRKVNFTIMQRGIAAASTISLDAVFDMIFTHLLPCEPLADHTSIFIYPNLCVRRHGTNRCRDGGTASRRHGRYSGTLTRSDGVHESYRLLLRWCFMIAADRIQRLWVKSKTVPAGVMTPKICGKMFGPHMGPREF